MVEVWHPGSALRDPAWLRDRVADTRRRWDCPDDRVAGTLWWYSASAVVVREAATELLHHSAAPDPGTTRLSCTLTEYGYLRTVRSSGAALPVGDYARALSGAYRHMIEPLARVSGATERALWAIASDSVANQSLAAGHEAGRIVDAGRLARAIAVPPLLPPRFLDVVPLPLAGGSGAGTTGNPPDAASTGHAVVPSDADRAAPVGGRRVIKRNSCCLLYAAPSQRKCLSCPRQRPDDRNHALRQWLSRP